MTPTRRQRDFSIGLCRTNILTTDSTLISTEGVTRRKYLDVLGTPIAYVDVGDGNPIVFLNGKPTPSYVRRRITPHVLPYGPCLAPDHVGVGNPAETMASFVSKVLAG